MNRELLDRLYDAGFPCIKGTAIVTDVEGDRTRYFEPTLDEILHEIAKIANLGYRRALRLETETSCGKTAWKCRIVLYQEFDEPSEIRPCYPHNYSDVPEEAAAELYIKLKGRENG